MVTSVLGITVPAPALPKMVIENLKTLSQVSQDLDIPLQTLHSWVNKGRKGELSGVGTYNPDLVALQN